MQQQGALSSILSPPAPAAPSARPLLRSPLASKTSLAEALSPLPGLAAPGAATTASRLPGAAGAEAAIESGKASLLAAFERSYGASPGAGTGGASGPPSHAVARAAREPKDARSAPKDIFTSPTPALTVSGGDVPVPSGSVSVRGASLVPLKPFLGGGAEGKDGAQEQLYGYSLAASADALVEVGEALAAAEARAKECDKKAKAALQRASFLERDLGEAYRELEGVEGELRGLRDAERAAARRPDLLAVLRGGLPTSAGTPLSALLPLSSTDRARLFDLLRRLPVLACLPEAALWELLHASRTARLGKGASLASLPAASSSLLLLVSGALGTAAGAVRGMGEALCEHRLWDRAPAPGSEAAAWTASADCVVLCVPSPIVRRFLTSEAALLDCWSEGAIASLVAPSYAPGRPPLRMGAHSHPEAVGLASHVALHAALLAVCGGGEGVKRRDKVSKGRAGGVAGAMEVLEEGEEDASSSRAGGRAAAASPSAPLPPHLAQNAPLLLHLLTASLPGIGLDEALRLTIEGAGRFWDMGCAALVECDTSALMLHSGAGRAPLATLIHRVVCPPGPTPLGVPLPLAGLAGLAVQGGAVLSVRDTWLDSRYNAALEPIAGPAGARCLLYVPVFVTLPGGGAQRVAGVLVLGDKRTDTRRLVPGGDRQADEESGPGEEAGGMPTVLDPGVVCVVGGGKPIFAFTNRDEELAAVVARRCGDLLSAALRQAVMAQEGSGAGGGGAAEEGWSSVGAGRDPTRGIVGVGERSGVPQVEEGEGVSPIALSPPRLLPLWRVSETLQWRVRSTFADLGDVAGVEEEEEEEEEEEGEEGDGEGYGVYAAPSDPSRPPTALLSIAGAVPPPPAPPPSPALYIYARAVLVLGGAPITPDVSSPSARAVGGPAGGRAGGGPGMTARWGGGEGLPPGAPGATPSLLDDPLDGGKGWIELPARACDLARGTSLVVALHEAGERGAGRALAWGTLPLFNTASGTLCLGRVTLTLTRGAWPGGPGAGVGGAGVLELDLGAVGVGRSTTVVDTDLARAGAWRSLALAAGVAMEEGGGRGEEGPQELVLDPRVDPRAAAAAAAAAGRSSEGLGQRIPVSPFYAAAGAAASALGAAAGEAGMGGGGGMDPRSSAPSALPALQAGGGGEGRPAPAQPGLTPASLLPLLRVSPGVAELSEGEAAVLRALLTPNASGAPPPDGWSAPSPHTLSPPLRHVLWTYRTPLLAAAGPSALPLLLRAAPFACSTPPPYEGGAGSGWTASRGWRAATALLSRPLPAPIALQLMDGGVGIPALRAAAAASLLLRVPLPTLLPLIPGLALAALAEGGFDTPLLRLLLSACVEAPRTFGRQLLWAWRAAAASPALRPHALLLLRAVLDALPAVSTAEEALAGVALAGVAAACRRGTLGQPGGGRTRPLRALLGALPLPHTLRLPLRAHEPVIPSAYYRALGDGSLAAAMGDAPPAGVEGGEGVGRVITSPLKSPSRPARAMGRGAEEEEEGDGESEGGTFDEGEEEGGEEGEGDVVRDVEDGLALALVTLGAYSDGPAWGLPSSAATDGPGLLAHMREAREALGAAGDEARPVLAAASVRAIGAAVPCAPAHPLPFTAAVEEAVQRAAEAGAAVLARASASMSEAERIIASQRGGVFAAGAAPSAIALPPVPTGTALPAAGLCVGGLAPSRCRILLVSPRRRYSRVLLALPAALDTDEDGEGGDADAPFAQLVKMSAHMPRPLRWRGNAVHAVLVSGDDGVVMAESLAASLLNTLSATWRRAGLRVGDATCTYVYGVGAGGSRDPLMGAWAGADAVGGRLFGVMLAPPACRTLAEVLGVPSGEGEGNSRDEEGAEEGTGAGYGHNGLQRWFMAALYAARGGKGREEEEGKGEEGTQYETTIRTFATCLAGTVVGCYVLALGERSPADLLLTPSGHLSLAGLSYTNGCPDPALHLTVEESEEGAGAGLPSSRFASSPLLAELLSVLGPPSSVRPCTVDGGIGPGRAGRLGATEGIPALVVSLSPLAEAVFVAALDAFMAARAGAQDILTAVGMHTTLCLPGAASPRDVACMRARLFTALPPAEARSRAAHALVAYMGLDFILPSPVPSALAATAGLSSFAGPRAAVFSPGAVEM
jgi:hypothetical protein